MQIRGQRSLTPTDRFYAPGGVRKIDFYTRRFINGHAIMYGKGIDAEPRLARFDHMFKAGARFGLLAWQIVERMRDADRKAEM